MTRILITLLLRTLFTLLILYSVHSIGNTSSTVETIFQKVKQANNNITPPQYEALVQSPLIRAQLKTIPRNMIVFGKTPYVRFLFNKQSAISLKVMNVENYYENMLKLYEEILTHSGILFGINEFHDYQTLSTEYLLKWNANNRSLQVKEKEGLSGDYVSFYLDDNFLISSSEYYENNKKVAETQFNWIKRNNYKFVQLIKIKFTRNNQVHHLDMKFSKIRF